VCGGVAEARAICDSYQIVKTRISSIAEKADRLSAADRIKLVEHLLDTLNPLNSEIDAAWVEESERRLDTYLRGDATVRNAKDVLSKHLKRM
jgi:putative addiction module component (TIGR02574 family)